MVKLGLIGLGEAWESRYRAALARLQNRATVRAVYDAVFSRAAHVAAEIDADTESGLLALARRPDIQAVLLLETNWHGCESLRMLCTAGKPIFVAADPGADIATLQAVHWTAVSFGLTVMPALGCRYTPASARLQELLATRLGRAEKLTVTLPCDSDGESTSGQQRRQLINWFDWAGYVFRSTPVRLQANGSPDSRCIRIDFAPTKGSEHNPVAEILLNAAVGESENAAGQPEVLCRSGKAVLETPTVIRWENGTAAQTETLTSDRDETEVMLDHFCRRVVGGLIPVADLADVSRSLELVRAVEQSESTGQPVVLSNRAST